MRQNTGEVLAPARDLQNHISVLGVLSLLGVLAMVYLATRSLVNPVRALSVESRTSTICRSYFCISTLHALMFAF